MAKIRLGIVQTVSRSLEEQQPSGENLPRSGPDGFSLLSAGQPTAGISQTLRHNSNTFQSIAKIFPTYVQRQFSIAWNSSTSFGNTLGAAGHGHCHGIVAGRTVGCREKKSFGNCDCRKHSKLWRISMHSPRYRRRHPRPQQLATYYNKVALVFWKAGNDVFHATTVLKLYVLHKELKKNITTHTELARLSTKACKMSIILILITASPL